MNVDPHSGRILPRVMTRCRAPSPSHIRSLFLLPFFLLLILAFLANRLRVQVSDSPLDSSVSSQKLLFQQNGKAEKQRIVILAGPRKTATTSLFENIVEWSSQDVLGNWFWGHPNMTCLRKLPLDDKSWGYIPKSWSFVIYCLGKFPHFGNNTDHCQSTMACYDGELEKPWKSGKNIVIGTGYIATYMVELRNQKKNFPEFEFPLESKLVQGLGHLLPQGAVWNDPLTSVEIVITYRAPRIEHLVSVWHQYRSKRYVTKEYNKKNDPITLRQYLLGKYFKLSALDPLFAAHLFAQDYNIDVAVIDMSGTKEQQLDISNVVACHILYAPCFTNGTIKGVITPPLVLHARQDDGLNDLSQEQLTRIDLVLQKLDCNSAKTMLSNPHIQILHGYLLRKTLDACPTNHVFYDSDQAIRDIQDVVRDS